MLVGTMQRITSNFKLGKLKEPCDGCADPYGYKHHMRLSTDTLTFAGEVKRAQVSGNLDTPKGGFDDIMQAVV